MTCYCSERESNPELAQSLKNIPEGYCGLCDICGEPGHMRAHPRLSTTGVWCEQHWQELTKYRIITLSDMIQVIMLLLFAGGILLFGYGFWHLFN